MILNELEADTRLSSPDNLVNIIHKEMFTGGKTKGSTDIPPLVRKLIGVIANKSNESQYDIADTFGITQPVVSSASRGLVGPNKLDRDLALATREARTSNAKEVKEKTEEAHELALDSLVSSLNHLNPKLQNIHDPKVLSRVASDMAKITANLASSKRINEAGVVNNTQVVLFGVQQRKESAYETIEG